jgi:hypothetical protein
MIETEASSHARRATAMVVARRVGSRWPTG